ncbi:MAG: formate/nitrite transporter family protein [Bacillota bacterium]|nr:formate/nitrite transporter family protein [Bacillota bacterium]
MNALTPPEIYEKISDSGIAKSSGSLTKLFLLGILAGAFIAFGAQASLMASFNLTADPGTFGVGKVVMAAVFPVGLMMVVLCGAELFTGNSLMITGLLDRKFTLGGMLRNWAIVYIGNLVGSLLIVVMIAYSGLWDSGAGLLGAVTVKTAIGKCSLSFGRAIVLGILCNIMVCMAVWMATGSAQVIGKIFAIWFCTGLFIVSGFEHSVANMYFIPAGLIAAANDSYVQLLGLDTSGLSTGAFLIKNLLPVTIGNIIGGSVFVGCTYWICYSKGRSK